MKKIIVSAVLLALLVTIGAVGQVEKPKPVPVPLSARIPPEVDDEIDLINDAISFYSPILRGTPINIAGAAWWGNAGQKQLLIVAPAARIIPRPRAIVGLIGVHNIAGLPTNFYVLRLGDRLDKVLAVDIRDVAVASLPAKISGEVLMAAAAPQVHIRTWQEGPGQPLKAEVCIGWKKANCDCIGIHIKW
jgi:hypothetical protein